MKFRVLALGAAIGFALAVVPSCGTKQQPRCLRSNCSGCCDDKLGCMPGTGAEACGTGALTCEVCGAGQFCDNGSCRTGGGGGGDGGSNPDAGPCGPQTCSSGCCLSGECRAGNQNSACGRNGTNCVQCPSGQSCQANACSSSACTGCRDVSGLCQLGTSTNACGADGGVCAACYSNQTCVNGACVGSTCNPTSCPNGCCAGPNISDCVDPGNTNAQCGTAGANCATCQGQEQCTQGSCYFDGGTSSNDGGFDLDSGFGNMCGPGTADPCNNGCCAMGLICDSIGIIGCGTGGVPCQACPSGKICLAGTCI